MQENDQSRRAGRPSLLSEQTPEGDSGSILSKLDGGAGAPRSGKAGGGAGRVAGIAAAVALTGGAIGWMMSSADAPPTTPLPVAAVAPQPQAPAAAGVPTSATAPIVPAATAAAGAPIVSPTGGGSDVSAAAILDETPAKPESGAKSLAASLEAPSAKPGAAPGGKDELIALLDKPPVAPVAGGADTKPAAATEAKQPPKTEPKSEQVKLAKTDKTTRKDKAAKEKLAARDKAKAREKARLAAAQKKRPAATTKRKAPEDADAALLAALLSHTKKTPARSKMSEYQKCSTRENVAAADKCRERLCASGAKAPAECKPPRVAKASD